MYGTSFYNSLLMAGTMSGGVKSDGGKQDPPFPGEAPTGPEFDSWHRIFSNAIKGTDFPAGIQGKTPPSLVGLVDKGCEGTIRFAPEERRLNLNPPTTPDTKQWPSVCKIIHRRQLRGRLGEEYRPAPSTRGRRHSSTWQPRLSNRADGASADDQRAGYVHEVVKCPPTKQNVTMWPHVSFYG